MTEMLETSKDNVYIKISIDDDVNNNSNQVYIDKEFIESIPNAESGETILNAITAFANLQSSLITFTVFGLGDIVIEKDPQDPLKLSLKLLEFGSGLVIDNISLLLELGINGMKGLKILSKENLYTTLITMGIEEIAKDIIEYECISKLYNAKYSEDDRYGKIFEEARRLGYLTINTSNHSILDIKEFLYYTGILNDSKIKKVYINTEDGIYKLLKPQDNEFQAIEEELNRRGYFGKYVTGGSNFSTLLELNEPDTAEERFTTRQSIDDYINESGFRYKDNDYILIKNNQFTYPLIGNVNNNIIYGDDKERILYGDGGSDFIYGGSKKDIIYGDKSYWYNPDGDGDDTLLGGLGDDEIHGEDGDDILIGDKADYTEEELLSFKDTILSNNGYIDTEKFESDNDGNDEIHGGSGNDIIIGGGGNDELYGDSGKDVIHGGTGDDTINGGSDDDDLYGEDGDDIIDGGDGNDIIHGANEYEETPDKNEKNVLIGGKGKDTIYGGYGDDVIITGSSNLEYSDENKEKLRDLINKKDNIKTEDFEADSKENEVEGQDGNDLIIGDKGKDIIHGGKGDDYIYGGKGNDELYGGDGDDHLYGEIGNDYMNGGNNHDKLWGGQGDDVIVGGEGADDIWGGSGNDILIAGSM